MTTPINVPLPSVAPAKAEHAGPGGGECCPGKHWLPLTVFALSRHPKIASGRLFTLARNAASAQRSATKASRSRGWSEVGAPAPFSAAKMATEWRTRRSQSDAVR
jgi:hypothetical protein